MDITDHHTTCRAIQEAHVAWAAAEYASEIALGQWRTSTGSAAGDAYAAYVAALDREEQAARVLADTLALAASDPPPGRSALLSK